MKEMDKTGIREDAGSIKQGVPMSMPYNPGHDNDFFLPVGGGPNKSKHPAKDQPEELRYMKQS